MPDQPTFAHAIATVHAELTPQPWEYTDGSGATLTVIPAALPEDPGYAEVYVTITVDKTHAVEAAITTSVLPTMIAALTGNRMWSHTTIDDVWCQLTPSGGGGMILALSEDPEATEQPQVHIPEEQRLPLASALNRAADVARGWEDGPDA